MTNLARPFFLLVDLGRMKSKYLRRLGLADVKVSDRWVKLTALLSLWAFFFGLVAMVHVWISILALPNRWKIISRLNRNFMLLFRLILNIKVIAAGEEGQLERGGYVVVANHVGYVDGIVLGSLFPILLVSKKEVKGGPSSANGILLRHDFYKPATKRKSAVASP